MDFIDLMLAVLGAVSAGFGVVLMIHEWRNLDSFRRRLTPSNKAILREYIHGETPAASPNRQHRNRLPKWKPLVRWCRLIVNGHGLSSRYSIVGPPGRAATHKGLVQPFAFGLPFECHRHSCGMNSLDSGQRFKWGPS